MALRVFRLDTRAKPRVARKFLNKIQAALPIEEFRELPIGAKIGIGGFAAIAGAGVAVAAVPEALVILGIAGGGAAGAGVIKLADFLIGGPPIVTIINDEDKLKDYNSFQDAGWINGAYYIEHPKMPNMLIPSSSFHLAIVDEQMRDLVAFYRSIGAVSRIKLEITGVNEGSFSANAPMEAGNVSGKATFKHARSVRLTENYDEPEIVALRQPLLWMDNLQAIRERATAQPARGSTEFEVQHDLSFGLTAGVASLAGIEANWLSSHLLSIQVTYQKPLTGGLLAEISSI